MHTCPHAWQCKELLSGSKNRTWVWARMMKWKESHPRWLFVCLKSTGEARETGRLESINIWGSYWNCLILYNDFLFIFYSYISLQHNICISFASTFLSQLEERFQKKKVGNVNTALSPKRWKNLNKHLGKSDTTWSTPWLSDMAKTWNVKMRIFRWKCYKLGFVCIEQRKMQSDWWISHQSIALTFGMIFWH